MENFKIYPCGGMSNGTVRYPLSEKEIGERFDRNADIAYAGVEEVSGQYAKFVKTGVRYQSGAKAMAEQVNGNKRAAGYVAQAKKSLNAQRVAEVALKEFSRT